MLIQLCLKICAAPRPDYCTVSVTATVWIEGPPLASTVSWLVPAGVPGVNVLVTVVVLPPQLVRLTVVPATATKATHNANRQRAEAPPRRLRPTVIQSPATRTPDKDSPAWRTPFPVPGMPRRDVVGAAVVIVSVVVAATLLGVIDGGAKLHVAPEGNPAHRKMMVWAKPFWGVTVKVNIALPPAATVAVDGLAEMVKSAVVGGNTCCCNPEDVDPLSNVSPEYWAVIE